MNWYTILVSLVLFSTICSCHVLGDGKQFFSPGIGFIEVRSDLEGARVYFDTLYMGYISNGKLTIPVDTTAEPSWKNVRMEYSEHLPYAGPYIQPEAGKTIAYKIDLASNTTVRSGIVRLMSEPAGVEFFLNNKSIGTTPDSGILIAYTVPRGLYEVSARKPGYETRTDQLYVDGNAVTTYHVRMNPSPLGELQINSKPEGGEIYIDNRMIGLTPLRVSDMSVGEHTVRIRLDGYQEWIANVSVLGGSMGSVEAILVSSPIIDHQNMSIGNLSAEPVRS